MEAKKCNFARDSFKKSHGRAGGVAAKFSSRSPWITACFAAIGVATLTLSSLSAAPQQTEAVDSASVAEADSEKKTGKVIDIKNVCVHVLKLEETLKLYKDILGFKHVKSVTLRGEGIEGMVVREMRAGGCLIHLSLPAPEYADTVEPIGNTNHNHFMLLVDDIVPICDKLKAAGYELENENYAHDKYSFFTGPNGEIVGLTEYK